MQKNERLILTAVDYSEQGVAVCKHEGFVVFVKGMLVGEVADVLIMRVNTRQAFGRLMEVIEPSKDRVVPRCPIAYQCGGCQLQHMSAEHQAEFKHKHVTHLFDRQFATHPEVLPIISMEDPWFYRNKSQVPFEVKEELEYGYYRAHSHTILPFETCFIQNDESNQILKFIKDFYFEQNVKPVDLRHVLIKKAFASEQLMVILVHKTKTLPLMNELTSALLTQFPKIKAIVLNVNKKDDNVILGDKFIPLTLESTIEDRLGDFTFKISPSSFYQVNPVQAKVLYDHAVMFAQLKGTETVLDLYSGIGTISLFLAKQAKKVYGIEINPQAIEDAKTNAELNKLSNVEFLVGDAKEAVRYFIEEKIQLDVILVDPPRKGLDKDTLDAIKTLSPDRVVYVSCDPSTLVRDCKLLEETYKVEMIQPVDMFPQTYHVEAIILMTRSGSGDKK